MGKEKGEERNYRIEGESKMGYVASRSHCAAEPLWLLLK